MEEKNEPGSSVDSGSGPWEYFNSGHPPLRSGSDSDRFMGSTSPILDHASSSRRRVLPWQTMAALPVLLLAPMTMCVCGHMNWISFPFTFVAAGLSWWGFARQGSPTIWRVLVMALVVLASLMLIKNVADILWLGHGPLLG